jgi:hypothetical protein
MPNKERVSRIFKIGRDQASLDFVDVDISTDTAVFISPKALRDLNSNWGHKCISLVQDFFGHILHLIKTGNHDRAIDLLGTLREPNETHLGLSRGRSQGRGLGSQSATDVWLALTQSGAAQSGLLTDLEETTLLIKGIGVDLVSDITTNIIRRALIEYTQEMAEQYNIPLLEGIPSGPLWNSYLNQWEEEFTRLPMTKHGKLILIPKVIVRQYPFYNLGKYFRNYLLADLQTKHINANTSLVSILKDGSRKVYKSDIIEDIGGKDKYIVTKETIKSPASFEKYKAARDKEPFDPLSHDQLADIRNSRHPDWDKLLSSVISLPTGAKKASAYESSVEALLNALLYPDLVYPIAQHKLHDGRQRVDITYNNEAHRGFFRWAATHYPASQIFVECKNYSTDIANNELGQILMRFSPSRGKIGIIISRSFKNKNLFLQRCKDSVRDHRGFVIALDDEDLRELVDYRKKQFDFQEWPLLRDRFRALIN